MSAESPSSSRLWLLALGYIPILGLLVLLLEKRDPETRWHVRNGQLLFAALAVVGIVATLVGIAVPSLTCLYAVAMLIASLLYVFVATLAAVTALGGGRLVIPGISRYASRLSNGTWGGAGRPAARRARGPRSRGLSRLRRRRRVAAAGGPALGEGRYRVHRRVPRDPVARPGEERSGKVQVRAHLLGLCPRSHPPVRLAPRLYPRRSAPSALHSVGEGRVRPRALGVVSQQAVLKRRVAAAVGTRQQAIGSLLRPALSPRAQPRRTQLWPCGVGPRTSPPAAGAAAQECRTAAGSEVMGEEHE